MVTDNKEVVRDFYGKIVGTVETNSKTGEGLARDFYGKILGTYDPNYSRGRGGSGCTRDFYGKIIGYGNQLHGLLWNPAINKSLNR